MTHPDSPSARSRWPRRRSLALAVGLLTTLAVPTGAAGGTHIAAPTAGSTATAPAGALADRLPPLSAVKVTTDAGCVRVDGVTATTVSFAKIFAACTSGIVVNVYLDQGPKDQRTLVGSTTLGQRGGTVAGLQPATRYRWRAPKYRTGGHFTTQAAPTTSPSSTN